MRSWATVSGSTSGFRPAACAASRRRANSLSSAISASYAACSRLVIMVSSSGGWAGGWSRLQSGRFGRPQWGRPDRSVSADPLPLHPGGELVAGRHRPDDPAGLLDLDCGAKRRADRDLTAGGEGDQPGGAVGVDVLPGGGDLVDPGDL